MDSFILAKGVRHKVAYRSRLLCPPPTLLQDLFQLAEDMGMTDKMRSIALGQGQGTIAVAMIEKVPVYSFSQQQKSRESI